MQIKKSTTSTIERQKKWAMRFVFVFLVANIIYYLETISRGSFFASHHSIMFNPFGTSGGDRIDAINVTIYLHVVVAFAFYVSHAAWKCGFGSAKGCQCLTVNGFATKNSSKDKEGYFTRCYWFFLNWSVQPWDIGEDFEVDHDHAAAVEVSGATGPNAAHINGVYKPVAEERVGGKPVYKKDGADIWIEYWPGKEQWQLKPASSKGSDAAYMHSLGTQKEAGMVEEVTDGKPIKWTVYDSTKNVWSEQDGTKVKVKRLSDEAPVYVLRMLLRLLWRLSKSGMRIDAPRILVASVYWV